MRPCHVVEIVTPKKYVLNGLWFGPKKPRNLIIFVHGLTASAFSMSHLTQALVDNTVAVLTFNNRGFEKVTEIKRRLGRKTKWITGGAAHEVFTECADDIEGAVRLGKNLGVRNIYIAGHSTGAQKAIYWAYKKKSRNVRGIILLGPLSDYASAVHDKGKKLNKAIAYAKKLVKTGKRHELMPRKMSGWLQSEAQRFLSLNTPDSVEQSIFSYFEPNKRSRVFGSIRVPILAVFAGKDEHADRPSQKIVAWFEHNARTTLKTVLVPHVKHNFRGAEEKLRKTIKKWIPQVSKN